MRYGLIPVVNGGAERRFSHLCTGEQKGLDLPLDGLIQRGDQPDAEFIPPLPDNVRSMNCARRLYLQPQPFRNDAAGTQAKPRAVLVQVADDTINDLVPRTVRDAATQDAALSLGGTTVCGRLRGLWPRPHGDQIAGESLSTSLRADDLPAEPRCPPLRPGSDALQTDGQKAYGLVRAARHQVSAMPEFWAEECAPVIGRRVLADEDGVALLAGYSVERRRDAVDLFQRCFCVGIACVNDPIPATENGPLLRHPKQCLSDSGRLGLGQDGDPSAAKALFQLYMNRHDILFAVALGKKDLTTGRDVSEGRNADVVYLGSSPELAGKRPRLGGLTDGRLEAA